MSSRAPRFSLALLSSFVVLGLGLGARPAAADPAGWSEGAAGRRRAAHLTAIGIASALYISSESFLKSSLAPSACRWCAPTGYDTSIRNSLVWGNVGTARTLSNLDGFVAAPVAALGLTMLSTAGDDGPRVGRWLDDTIPIVEAAVYASLFDQAVKFTVGEQRPFVHFGDPTRPHQVDDDVSFFSGHTTLVFALATSAGVVAHERHAGLEPLIWATGYTLAATTAYLRIAGDEHYFTDVAVGAAVGTAFGVGVPLLLHRDVLSAHGVAVVPTGTGITASGTF